MSLTLLIDLDDTLLDTNLSAFVPAYFQALGQHLGDRLAPDVLFPGLMSGTTAMNASEDPTRTLEQVFDSEFYPKIGLSKAELAPALNDFYTRVFPSLGEHTRQRREAAALIEWALSGGIQVAIATDPFLPRQATYHRLRWAGIDPERIELITTFEHFHFSKTFPAYYAEVLGRLGWPEGPVLMVGNDVQRDLMPAHQLGLATYLIDDGTSTSPGFESGRGTLADLQHWLKTADWSRLQPSFESREAILAILAATPAVLQSLTLSLSEEQWRHEPTPEDWAPNEIICHLRDTEREIHQLQLNLLLEREGAFIPRPDTGIWANEREYLYVNGQAALAEFAAARLATLKKLKAQSEQMWSRRARHAIFGPTNFREVMRFIADHDRLHIQQAWKTLRNINEVPNA